MVEKAQETMK